MNECISLAIIRCAINPLFYMRMKLIVTIGILCIIQMIFCGHEVLYKYTLNEDDIQPNDLAIVQYDSRPISQYWNTSARWNKAYCEKYGHQYYYLSSRLKCKYNNILLANAWCKVKAMISANNMITSAKAFLFLDSDAVITVNYSMSTVLGYISKSLHWDFNTKPVAFNQDGPGWSCKYTIKLGYRICFNSGTIFWLRSPLSETILTDWWNSASEPYGINKFPTKWKIKWPWEQSQMYEVYNRYHSSILVLSFPNLPHLPWTSKKNPKSQYPTDYIEPWCLSHWPGANCFITHHCSSKNQKLKLQRQYDLPYYNTDLFVHYIDL